MFVSHVHSKRMIVMRSICATSAAVLTQPQAQCHCSSYSCWPKQIGTYKRNRAEKAVKINLRNCCFSTSRLCFADQLKSHLINRQLFHLYFPFVSSQHNSFHIINADARATGDCLRGNKMRCRKTRNTFPNLIQCIGSSEILFDFFCFPL